MKRLLIIISVLCLLLSSITSFASTEKYETTDGENVTKPDGITTTTPGTEDEKFAEEGDDTSSELTPENTWTYNGHRYALYFTNISWEDARKYCISIGGHLATLTSQEEHDKTYEESGGNYVWIGGYRDSSYVWYWVTDEEWDYTNWDEGEPNNSSNVVGNEYCATLWYGGLWNDLNSENLLEQNGFICEWDDMRDDGEGVPDGLDKPLDEKVSPISIITYGGHIYKLYDEILKWTEARAYCESIGGHLATVTSEEENSVLIDLMKNGDCSTYWLGAGIGSENWMWITESDQYNFRYTNFKENLPSSYKETNYLQINTTGLWTVSPNVIITSDGNLVKQNVGFICEIEPDPEKIPYDKVTSAKIDSTEKSIKIDLEFESNPEHTPIAVLQGTSYFVPKTVTDTGDVEFENIQGDKKYTVKVFFWDENLNPFSEPMITEIFVK